MFTGIVTNTGKVQTRIRNTLSIISPKIVSEIKKGDSICVNGVCLTVTNHNNECFSCDLLDETLKKTNLGNLKTGEVVNLELALRAGDRLGGHLVTGHIDCTGRLLRKFRKGNDTVMEVEIPVSAVKNIFPKGSIAVNGVSLTIVNTLRNRFTVHIIPHTLKNTNLGQLHTGSLVNVETDKYLRHD